MSWMSGLALFIFEMVKLHKLWEVGALHLIHNLLKTSLGPLSSIYCRKSLNILWRDLNEEYINVDPEEYVFYVVRNKDKKWNWHVFSLKRQCASFVSWRSRDLIAVFLPPAAVATHLERTWRVGWEKWGREVWREKMKSAWSHKEAHCDVIGADRRSSWGIFRFTSISWIGFVTHGVTSFSWDISEQDL